MANTVSTVTSDYHTLWSFSVRMCRAPSFHGQKHCPSLSLYSVCVCVCACAGVCVCVCVYTCVCACGCVCMCAHVCMCVYLLHNYARTLVDIYIKKKKMDNIFHLDVHYVCQLVQRFEPQGRCFTNFHDYYLCTSDAVLSPAKARPDS